jgi:hypothetical protein
MSEVKQNPIIDYMFAAGQNAAQNKAAAIAITTQLDNQEEANSAAQVARSAVGASDQVIESEKQKRQLALDAHVADIQTEFGADPVAQGSASNIWLKRMQEDSQKAYATLDQIHENQSKTLLNDPVGYIMNQFTAPADIAEHNYYVNRYNIAEEALKNITSASHNNVIAANHAAAKTSQESAIAEAEKIAATTAYDLANLKGKTAGDRIRGLGELNSLNNQQLAVVFQAHAAANSDESLALQKQNHADMLALRKEALEAKKDKLIEDEATMNDYNVGAKAFGRPQFSDIKTFIRMSKTMQTRDPEFMKVLGYGQDVNLKGGVTNDIPISNSAGHTALVYASGTVTPGNVVGKFLAEEVAQAKLSPTAPKDREALAAHITDIATTQALNSQKRIIPNKGNIYEAPPTSVVMSSVAAASDPFLSTVIKPTLDVDPKVKISDELMFGKALDFAKANKANLNVAASGLQTYYQKAVLENNLLNQYVEKGLPAQKDYRAVIDGKVVDMTNIVDVKRALLSNMGSINDFGGSLLPR